MNAPKDDVLAAAVAELGALPMPTGESVHADSKACGTCKSLVRDGKPVEHEQCAARAVLLLPPDQPMYEDLVDLTDEQRKALPARFHTPVFDGLGKPNAWLCQVCWGDGWVSQWPCGPAQQKGAMVFVSEVTAEDIAAELTRLRARVTELEGGPDDAVCASATRTHVCVRDENHPGQHRASDGRTLWPRLAAPRDLHPGADTARRMIRDRQTTEDPHDSPLHHTYAEGRDLPEVAP